MPSVYPFQKKKAAKRAAQTLKNKGYRCRIRYPTGQEIAKRFRVSTRYVLVATKKKKR